MTSDDALRSGSVGKIAHVQYRSTFAIGCGIDTRAVTIRDAHEEPKLLQLTCTRCGYDVTDIYFFFKKKKGAFVVLYVCMHSYKFRPKSVLFHCV